MYHLFVLMHNSYVIIWHLDPNMSMVLLQKNTNEEI